MCEPGVPFRQLFAERMFQLQGHHAVGLAGDRPALAVRNAIGSYTPQQLVRLNGLIDETEIVDPQDSDELFRLGRAFHLALVEPAANDYLRGVITSIWNHPIQHRITLTYRQGPDHQAKVIHDHRSILQALKGPRS